MKSQDRELDVSMVSEPVGFLIVLNMQIIRDQTDAECPTPYQLQLSALKQ